MDHWKRKAGRVGGLLLLAALLALTACGPSAPATLDPHLAATVAVIQTQNVLPVTGSTPGAADPAETPAAGGRAPGYQVPLIIVQDQDVSAGQVTLNTVISSGPAWAVIHAIDNNGSVGAVIGYAPVKDGLSRGVTVPIDAAQATPVLFAVLHQDAGKSGTFEYPGPDQPVTYFGQPVLSAFHNSAGTASRLNQLNATATALIAGGLNPTPLASSASGAAAGSTPVTNTPAFTATAAAAPATPVPTPAATTTQPPSVSAFNQRLKNGQVNVAEVVSQGPGWIVVYSVSNGQPGQVLGYAAVRNGANENVPVSLLPLASGRTLIAVLHTDAGKPGVFEFPGADMPVLRGQKLTWAEFNLLP